MLIIELNPKLKYVYKHINSIIVIVNHFFHFKWFFWLIINDYHYFLKKSKIALKIKKLTLEVPLFIIELNLKLKYVYKHIKWLLVIVNHFTEFKWLNSFTINDYHLILKILLKIKIINIINTIINNLIKLDIKIYLYT